MGIVCGAVAVLLICGYILYRALVSFCKVPTCTECCPSLCGACQPSHEKKKKGLREKRDEEEAKKPGAVVEYQVKDVEAQEKQIQEEEEAAKRRKLEKAKK